MKTCPVCAAENNADSKFCSACGGALVPGPEATVDHNPPNNASASPSISDSDSSDHGRFLPGRAPLIGRLGYGELRLRRGMEVRRFFVDGGFVQVRANTVTVLTSRAQRAEDIDTNAVSQALHAALAPAPTPQVHEEQLRTQERARAQLRVARHREEGHR